MNEKKLRKLVSTHSKFSQNKISSILEKVRYNQPEIYNQKINTNVLKKNNIPIDRPIFLINAKDLNFSYAKNLYLTNLIQNFSLVVFVGNEKVEAYQKFFLSSAIFFNKNQISQELKKELFKLNINNNKSLNLTYGAKSNVEILESTKQKTTLQNLFLETVFECEKQTIILKKTYYYGKYYFFEIKNKINKKNIFFIKIKLKNNNFEYFLIKNNIIYSFFNKNKYYFFCSEKSIKTNIFVDKKSKEKYFVLEIKTNKNFFVYFGKSNEHLNCFENILQKIENQFSLKIYSEDKKLEYLFNKFFPNQIIKEKLYDIPQNNVLKNHNLTFSQIIKLYKNKIISAGSAYKKIQEHIFTLTNKNITANKLEYKNLRMFFNYHNQNKEMLLFSSNEKKLIVGDITYLGLNSITEKMLEKNNRFEFYL